MTGFGGASREHDSVSLRAEVRSVNHRHLQVKTRLPSELAALEPAVEKRVRGRLGRGSVTVTVSLTLASTAQAATINQELLARYRHQLLAAARELGLDGGLDLATLVALPGVLAAPEVGVDDQALEPRVLETVDAAVDALVAMRRTEGAALEAELRRLAAGLGEIVARIEERVPAVVAALHAGLRERVSELLGPGAELSDADLAREVALLADRADVSEELARLKSHLDQLAAALEAEGAVGRRLDFLVQELLREVNTIGSKASDAEIAHRVIDAKTAIERLREQIQNVE
jgi:uncharacterized protein (TIGR00255 family)